MKNNVFIIIVNWNGKQYLDDCLSSLEDQTYKFFKTIIIDNNSSDDSVEFIKKKFIQIKIIQNTQNFGFAQGNNIGIKYALQNNADIIILLNNDTIVDKNWLQEMINTANSNKKIGLVQAKIFIDNKDKKHIINTVGNNIHYLGFGYCGHYKEIDNGQFSKDTEITYAIGASLLIKKKVLYSIGMLDEKFFLYHEDLDLGWRARLFGFNIYLSNKAIVWHKYSFSKNKKKIYYLERNRLFFLLQNFELRTLCLILPAFLFIEIGLLFYSLLNGWFLLKLKSYIDVIKKIKIVIIHRKHIQKNRIVKDKELIKYLTDQIIFEDINSIILNKIINPLFKLYFIILKIIFNNQIHRGKKII